jgi:MFS family permease
MASNEQVTRQQLTRAVVASTIGTSIEWYDFFLYGSAAALVLNNQFFPNVDPASGVLLAFGTNFVGFAARPVGAAIFGHYGDRIGRKATLVITLALMGIGTFLVGLVPPYASIGVAGGLILTVLRALQGIGVGGEWGGSVLLSMEWGARTGRRGFIASWPQFGVPVGLLLSNGMLALVTALTGPNFATWGWRIPFLVSIVLVGVGLWIRLGILETPVFSRLLEQRRTAAAPVAEVLRNNWREVILTCLIRTGQQAPFYIFWTYVLTYATGPLQMQRQDVLNDTLIASAVSLVTVPLWGALGPAADLSVRRTRHGAVRLAIFRAAGHAYPRAGAAGHCSGAGCPRHPVRSPGCIHRRGIPPACTLQRRLAGIPSGVDHRWWSGADCRGVSVRSVRHVDGDCGVHHHLRADQSGQRGGAA